MDPCLETTARVRGTTSGAEAAARAMRRDPTPAESVLWQALRGRRLDGLLFRRQHALGPYILDFCCPACRLVVEVDGSGHGEQVDYDDAKERPLTRFPLAQWLGEGARG